MASRLLALSSRFLALSGCTVSVLHDEGGGLEAVSADDEEQGAGGEILELKTAAVPFPMSFDDAGLEQLYTLEQAIDGEAEAEHGVCKPEAHREHAFSLAHGLSGNGDFHAGSSEEFFDALCDA